MDKAAGRSHRVRCGFWIGFGLLLLSLLVTWIWYGRQARQNHLDRALVAAIKKNDTPAVIALLDRGADANVTDRPDLPITIQSLLTDFWNRLKGNQPRKSAKVYPSALLLPYWLGQGNGTYGNSMRGWHFPWKPKHPLDNPELVQALLEHGADPYAVNENGLTALHYACRSNHTRTVRVLLEHHVDPNRKDRDGFTPLMWADYDCAPLLIAQGADVNARDNTGMTALMFFNSLAKYQLLLEHKAEIDAQDNDGRTALFHAAIMFQDTERTRFLLRHGAKVSLKDRSGKTTLDYARDRGYPSLIPLLEETLKKERTQIGGPQ
jgi:hypothetical protein